MPPKNKSNKKGGNKQSGRQGKQSKGSLKPISAPAAFGQLGECHMSWTPTGDDGGIAEGREFIANVYAPDPALGAGANIDEFYLAPGEFGGTRLELKSREYQKFMFEEAEWEFCPAKGSDTPGSLCYAYDRDIATPTPPNSEQGLRQMLAYQDATFGNVWSPQKCKCPLRGVDKKDMLFTQPETGGDDRLSYQGQFFVAQMLPTGLAENTPLGSIILKYRCRFRVEAVAESLDSLQAGSTNAVSSGNNNFYGDLIEVVPDTYEGDGEYLPRNFGDGTSGLLLKEGLYRLIQWLGTTTYAGAGTGQFQIPTLELLEPPVSPNAPQGIVEVVSSQLTDGSGGNPQVDTFVSVPRGGGRLRQLLTFGGTLAATSAQCFYNILRVGSYLADLTGVLVPSPAALERMRVAHARKTAGLARPADARTVETICFVSVTTGRKSRSSVLGKQKADNFARFAMSDCVDGPCLKCTVCMECWPLKQYTNAVQIAADHLYPCVRKLPEPVVKSTSIPSAALPVMNGTAFAKLSASERADAVKRLMAEGKASEAASLVIALQRGGS